MGGGTRQDNTGLFKKGQSGNPNGRPKVSVTKRELLQAFNNEYAEIHQVFCKYASLNLTEINRELKRASRKNSTVNLKEITAMKYVAEAIKKGSVSRVQFIFEVILGQHGKFREIPELDGKNIGDLAMQFAQSDQNKQMVKELDVQSLTNLRLAYGVDMNTAQYKVLTDTIDTMQRSELAKLNMIDRKKMAKSMSLIMQAMIDIVGRNNPQLLMDLGKRMRNDLKGEWDIPASSYTIEVIPAKKKRKKIKR